jgi:phosphohistidine phosphatase
MEIYLLRHGKAGERSSKYPDDDKRPLTKEGVKEMHLEASGIRKIVPDFDAILTSPLTRAFQTASIVAKAYKQKPQLCDELSPEISVKDLLKRLEKYKSKKRILLVGHEPDFSMMAAALLKMNEPVVEFKKGGICRIDIPALPLKQAGQLIFNITPSILIQLGKNKKGERK